MTCACVANAASLSRATCNAAQFPIFVAGVLTYARAKLARKLHVSRAGEPRCTDRNPSPSDTVTSCSTHFPYMSVPEEKNLSSICRTVNTCDHCNVDTNCDDQTMFPIYSCFDDANLKRWCDGASITNDIVLHREQSRAKMVATDAQVQPAAQSSMLTSAVEPAEPAVSVDAVSVVHEFHGDGDYILLQRGMVATSKACELASGDSQLPGHMAGAGGADNASKHASPRTQKLASTAHWLSNWYGTGTDEHAHDTPRAATTRLRRTCNIQDCLPSVDKLGKGSY